MSWIDDPISKEEIKGVALQEALNEINNPGSPYIRYLSGMSFDDINDEDFAEEDEEEEKKKARDARRPEKLLSLDPSYVAELAHAAVELVLSRDIPSLESDMLGGVQLYDNVKLSKCVLTALDETVEAWRADGKVVERDASKEKYKIDVYANQGRRSHMEDRHVVFPDVNALLGLKDYPDQAFFAVYDGHGGVEAAKFAQTQLHLIVSEQPSFKDDVNKALHEGFLETDKQFLIKANRDALASGATACTVLIRDKKLYVSWLGDSQCMLFRAGEVVTLMEAHKPEREDEKKRIEDSGGVVVWYGAWRVNGVLSVARAIGDKKLKQWVIGEPSVNEFDLDGTEEYLIIGCDGLWDVMTPEKASTFVKEWRAQHDTTDGIAQAMVEHCIDTLSTMDNISIIIVFFN